MVCRHQMTAIISSFTLGTLVRACCNLLAILGDVVIDKELGTAKDLGLPIPQILCDTLPMKNLTANICLTIAVLLGSAGMSWSADF